MPKNNKKKNYSFSESFDIGKLVAEQRIELAKKYNNEDITKDMLDVKKYISLREELDSIYGFKNNIATILGQVLGCWENPFSSFFIPTDEFDRTIYELTNDAMKDLFS